MAYSMHRIFCATPGDLEIEREAFYKAMADFNERHAMPRGILFVSVSMVPGVLDLRPYQGVLAENIRSCRYYIQVLEDSWGPPFRNFEREYAVAMRCQSDPNLPMQDVAVLFKKPLLPHQMEPSVLELKQKLAPGPDFETPAEYSERVTALLTTWLETVAI